ncbi:transglutaminase domain-containing protein [Planctomycetota bacterium]|nr:transglutaminase domain-containing protein [Planctomycetota bacterium]
MRVRSVYRKLVFAMVMIGVCAFCIAEQSPSLLLIIAIIGGLSWWVTEGPHGKPLPRPIIVAASAVVMMWLLFDIFIFRTHTLVAMGHFTIWLQLLLLYSPKTNREYAQLMILSILQMIGASTISITMTYGIMLAIYCVITLFTILVFHLKLTSDRLYQSRKDAAVDADKVLRPIGVTSIGMGKHLRRTTLLSGTVCASIAVFVFMGIPRSPESNSLNRFASFSNKVQAGFSDTINLNRKAPQSSSNTPVINLSVEKNGKNIGSSDLAWLIRGAVLDRYNIRSRQWVRGNYVRNFDQSFDLESNQITLAKLKQNTDAYTATITYRGTAPPQLFTMPNIFQINSKAIDRVAFNPIDQQMRMLNGDDEVMQYSFKWTDSQTKRVGFEYEKQVKEIREVIDWDNRPNLPNNTSMSNWYARTWHIAPREVYLLAQSIIKEKGLKRHRNALSSSDDLAIAKAIKQYLQTNYQYSLQGPSGEDAESRVDPILRFLFNDKKGHCELFASGYAALCRSLGLQTRVITGYRAGEYNDLGGYYVIRTSDAHAWNEIKINNTWVTIDSTPPAQLAQQHAVSTGIIGSLQELYEYFDYVWLRSVVTFDLKSQRNLLSSIRELFNSGDDGSKPGLFYRIWRQFLNTLTFFNWNYIVIGLCVIVIIGVLIVFFFLHEIQTRRKAAQLHLSSLPRSQQRSLAKQLAFFITLQQLLTKHGHSRKSWQSPMQFANQLTAQNPQRYQSVKKLTQIFYDIRYGNRPLDESRKSIVDSELENLQHTLTS